MTTLASHPVSGVPALDRVLPYVPRVVLDHVARRPGELVRSAPGSLLFVDVSGFTALSERLARRGREGAESLAEAIGTSFASLLGVAYAQGGALLKFGGDALLLHFEGADHVSRACRAAIGMRRALRIAGRIVTGGMTVQLRMSVGVHTGEVQLVVAGGTHRELLVVGEVASTVLRMEQAASAGEIVISAELAGRLARACVGPARGPGFLLVREPVDPGDPPGLDLALPGADAAASCLSTGLREYVLAGAQPPEHRLATIAFLRLRGTDDLVGRQGVRAAATALGELVETVAALAEEHRICLLASDVDVDGAKLILTSGVPLTAEDDEERMLLALHRIVGKRLPLPLQIGVHRGPVFAGDIGPPFRRTYTVMGDAVNLAARVMARAPEGQIYATADVLDRSPTAFELDELTPFMVKGKSQPVRAWAVGAPRAGRRRRVGVDRTPLVGREVEMTALQAAVDLAQAGSGSLLVVRGEPGSGKTRLVEELLDRAPDLRHLATQAEAYTASTPYATFRVLMRRALGAEPDAPNDEVAGLLRAAVARDCPDLAPWLALVGVPYGLDLPPSQEVAALAPEFRQERTHDVVIAFILARLRLAPTVVTIEDAHLMDGASTDLLAALSTRLHEIPCLCIVTRREVEGGFDPEPAYHVIELHPAPLSRAEALELAEQLTRGDPVAPHDLRLAADRAGGNPQFVIELVRSARTGDRALPDSLEAAATARIDRLERVDQRLVRRASVLGPQFPRAALRWIDVEEPDAAQWQRLAGMLEITADHEARFPRAAVREAAYAGLPFAVRRELHARIGARSERLAGEQTDEVAPALSLHFLLGGDPRRAARYARSAAMRARRLWANHDAARLYRRTIEATRAAGEGPAALAGLHEELGVALADAGEPVLARDAYTAARRHFGDDPVVQGRLLWRQAKLSCTTGHIGSALRWTRRGRRALEGVAGQDAAAMRARLLTVEAFVRQRQDRFDDAMLLARQALEETSAGGAEEAEARAYVLLDWALTLAGRHEEAIYSERAIAIYRRLGLLLDEATALNNSGSNAYWRGDWALAVEFYELGAEAAGRAGNLHEAAAGSFNVGELRADQGRLAEGEAHLLRALQVFRPTGDDFGTMLSLRQLGRVATRAGRPDEAHEQLAEAMRLAQALKIPPELAVVRGCLAEALLWAGSCEDALVLARELLAGDTPELTRAAAERVVGWVALQRGDPSSAVAAFRRSENLARDSAQPFEVALALDALVGAGAATGDEIGARDAILARLGVVAISRPPRTVSAVPVRRAGDPSVELLAQGDGAPRSGARANSAIPAANGSDAVKPRRSPASAADAKT